MRTVGPAVALLLAGWACGCDDEPTPVGDHESLVLITDEAPGANCTYGGQKVEHGGDDNDDGVLQPSEVEETSYLCNEPDGYTSIVVVTTEEPGDNCTFGGRKAQWGIDDNDDGVLQPSEVDGTTYYCDDPGGWTTIVRITDEDPGSNCYFGGQKIETGIDDNGNGTLDPEEIDATEYVCEGSCPNGTLDTGEEMDWPISPFTTIDVDQQSCRWDFSGVRQLYCNGGWSWAGPSGCDQADADIFCKLLTDDPASTATSWTASKALDLPGFNGNQTVTGTVIYTDRGVSQTVRYKDASLLTDGVHGAGDVILDPVCTDP